MGLNSRPGGNTKLQRENRKLAAIVAADIAGYSRLIGRDEEGTLRALRAHRAELIDPAIESHGGRIANTAGDSFLLEFSSAVDAVRCSIAVQDGMAARNTGIEADSRIVFRIGINVGDVITQDGDLLGDGVNIAARLEGECEPGGIVLSDDAHRQVRGRIEADFADLGARELKNIAEAVTAWRWAPEGSAEPTPAAGKSDPAEMDGKPSVAVLPFDNMSSDPEHEYFADGIAEDIITALSKISRMRVIARNSTFVYKGKAHDLRQVASELGVRYVLEGSIRSGGKRLRITAQLIDASDGSHLWAERFDRTIDDIFDIQDEITKEIVTALRVNLTDGEEAHVLARGTNDIEAWQLCTHATELFMQFNSTDYLEARKLAEKAVARDPDYAYAWATLGYTHWWDGRLGFTGDTQAKFAHANDCAERAMALDDTVSWVIGLSTMVAGALNHHEEGVTVARRGLELHPGNADARAFLAFALVRAAHYREAVDHFRAAMLLNPIHPNWYRNGLLSALAILDEFDEGLALSDEILSIEPGFFQAWLQRAYIYHLRGQTDKAAQAISEVIQLAPDLRLKHIPGLYQINDEAATKRFTDSLRAAGLPEN